MSVSRSTSANSNTSINVEEYYTKFPLWRHVRVEKKGVKKRGKVRWQCNCCYKFYVGSYSCSLVFSLILKDKERLFATVRLLDINLR